MAHNEITLPEALSIINKTVQPLKTEFAPTAKALHRVLATNLYSRCDMPPFNKSAMDGYACKRTEMTQVLKLSGEIAAGGDSSIVVNSGECVRIMTGAPVPKGADWVMMQEIASVENGFVSFEKETKNSNICLKGEDLKTGDLILSKGTLISSREIAVIASGGYGEIELFKQPKVAIFATGDELLEPGLSLTEGKIFNSNGHQLCAECENIGINATYLGILPDSYETVVSSLKLAVANNDLTILTGGVSVGDYDFIPLALKELGFELKFDTLATKPGKHTIFATNNDKYVLGLPGNPVSTLVQFEMVGKELIYKLQGREESKKLLFKAPLAKEYKRKSADKLEFLPAIINGNNEIELLFYNGSAHIAALTKATVLVSIPIGQLSVNKGDYLDVRPL